jgi:hypothetical protein
MVDYTVRIDYMTLYLVERQLGIAFAIRVVKVEVAVDGACSGSVEVEVGRFAAWKQAR